VYTVLIRVNESLPWIELEGEYATRREARHAAQDAIRNIAVMVVSTPQERRTSKAFAVVRAER
jgi:hypothetical protein